MEKTVSSTELQKHTRDIIDQARIQGVSIVIETYGKPMVVLLPFEEYQQYRTFKAQRDERAARFAALHHLAEQTTAGGALSDAEADALIETAREERFRDRTAPADDGSR